MFRFIRCSITKSHRSVDPVKRSSMLTSSSGSIRQQMRILSLAGKKMSKKKDSSVFDEASVSGWPGICWTNKPNPQRLHLKTQHCQHSGARYHSTPAGL